MANTIDTSLNQKEWLALGDGRYIRADVVISILAADQYLKQDGTFLAPRVTIQYQGSGGQNSVVVHTKSYESAVALADKILAFVQQP